MFTVITPAASRALLTLSEIKSALGVTTSDRDAELTAFGLQISDLISDECRVPRGGLVVPTLLAEGLEDTIRLDRSTSNLILTRRFVSAVAAVELDGVALDLSTIEIDAGAGMLSRIVSRRKTCWECGEYVVSYTAGFSEIPGPLKRAAVTILREQASADSRDPLLRRRKIDGLMEDEWWVNSSSGSSSAAAISGVAAAMLDPYRYYVV